MRDEGHHDYLRGWAQGFPQCHQQRLRGYVATVLYCAHSTQFHYDLVRSWPIIVCREIILNSYIPYHPVPDIA